MKISSLIISLLIVTLTVTVFASYYTSIGTHYNVGTTFDNETVAGYQQYSAIQEQLSDLNESVNRQTTSTGSLDIANFIAQGYSTVKLTISSFSYFGSVLDAGFSNVTGWENFSLFKSIILAIALTAFIFILIRILVGSENI